MSPQPERTTAQILGDYTRALEAERDAWKAAYFELAQQFGVQRPGSDPVKDIEMRKDVAA